MMSDLELTPRFLQRYSDRHSPERGIHLYIEEPLDAAIVMRYDFWTYDFGMMINNIPSTIYISFDIVSPTASTAYLFDDNPRKEHKDGE